MSLEIPSIKKPWDWVILISVLICIHLPSKVSAQTNTVYYHSIYRPSSYPSFTTFFHTATAELLPLEYETDSLVSVSHLLPASDFLRLADGEVVSVYSRPFVSLDGSNVSVDSIMGFNEHRDMRLSANRYNNDRLSGNFVEQVPYSINPQNVRARVIRDEVAVEVSLDQLSPGDSGAVLKDIDTNNLLGFVSSIGRGPNDTQFVSFLPLGDHPSPVYTFEITSHSEVPIVEGSVVPVIQGISGETLTVKTYLGVSTIPLSEMWSNEETFDRGDILRSLYLRQTESDQAIAEKIKDILNETSNLEVNLIY